MDELDVRIEKAFGRRFMEVVEERLGKFFVEDAEDVSYDEKELLMIIDEMIMKKVNRRIQELKEIQDEE
jgi:citrate lyase gamma subunit